MAESLNYIKVTIEVDTNKRTEKITGTYNSWDEFTDEIGEQVEEIESWFSD